MPSPQAQLLAHTMRRLNLKKLISKNVLGELRRSFGYEEPPASFRLKYPVKVHTIDGCKCVYTKSTKVQKPKFHIIYFHGGSYHMPAIRVHWHMIESILSRVRAELTFVNYPLSPEHSCMDAIKMASHAYNYVASNHSENIVLMGDSAGGGLALALAQYLHKNRVKPAPKKLVLLSPWLDVSMDNDISGDLAKRDLLLDVNMLKTMGKQYARDMDTHNYLCSPLYGSKLKKLNEVAVFIGTNDILYAQAQELKKRMKRAKPPLSYYEYEDMPHVWMGYPIPEAKQAFDDIGEFLRK